MKVIVLIFIFMFAVSGITLIDSVAQAKESPVVAMYICPMHPEISSDKPGQCSICGMNLVLFEDDESEEVEDHQGHSHKAVIEKKPTLKLKKEVKVKGEKSAPVKVPMKPKPKGRESVKLRLDKQQLIGIETEIAKKMDLYKTIRAPGRIAFDPELYTAQSEYLEGLKQWEKVKSSPLKDVKRNTREMINSSKVRLQVMGLSEEQIKDLARKGSVSQALIVGGDAGENLVYADVYESDLSNVKKGQDVLVEGSFLEGQRLRGEVVSVDQVIDPQTRTGKVRIKIEKTEALIRPEAFVNVSISVPLGRKLAVSLESVLDTGRDLLIFVKKGKGKFEPRKITKLFETDEHIAILSGVEEGEVIVTSGNFMLDSESRLRSVIKRAVQPKHEH